MEQDVVARIWPWLPVFRVVAETEHLPTAAERLHLTASALSRTVRQLEEHLGVELFNRHGRNLVLNTAGQRLLGAVQAAMNTMGVGYRAISTDPFEGPLRVSALGVMTNHFVLPALLELKRAHPALVPMLRNYRTSEANAMLVQGTLDVAFYYEALTHPELIIERLGEASSSVYCGVEHPLYRKPTVGVEDLLEHAFSVPAIGDTGVAMDGWPVELNRQIGMHIWLLTTNLEVCLSGLLVTVLPDITALPWLRAGRLRRIPVAALPRIEMFAACHRASAERSATRDVIARVAGQIAQAKADVAAAVTAAGSA